MRVAIVSPYSWAYPGGVNRHIEALAAQLAAAGHEMRVLAPWDEDTRTTALRHRGARPHRLELPEWLIPLGPPNRRASKRAVPHPPAPPAPGPRSRGPPPGGGAVSRGGSTRSPRTAWSCGRGARPPRAPARPASR